MKFARNTALRTEIIVSPLLNLCVGRGGKFGGGGGGGVGVWQGLTAQARGFPRQNLASPEFCSQFRATALIRKQHGSRYRVGLGV